MPERSDPMLIVFAMKRAPHTARRTGRGNFLRSAPIRPRPVTMPIRAHIVWTAAISGQVTRAVHRSLVPNCAPATEYVAIPDGSSSAAPVITPGPSARQNLRRARNGYVPRETIECCRERLGSWSGGLPRRGRCGSVLPLPQLELRHRSADLIGQILFHLLRIERLQHRSQLRVVGERKIQGGEKPRHEVQRLRNLLLHSEIDLQRKLLAQLTDLRLPALRHQHEDREKDRLERDDGGEHAVRVRIELLKSRERQVPPDPADEDERV